MATASLRKEDRKHKKCKNAHFVRGSIRKSIFGEIDKSKEYVIYWLCDNDMSQSDYFDMSKMKLRGIVDYLEKISDINIVGRMDERNIFLIMNTASFEKYHAKLAAFKEIRSIYIHEKHGDKKNKWSKHELSVSWTKVHGPFHDIAELSYTLSKNIRTMAHQPNLANELPPLRSASKTIERSTSATYSYVTDWYIYLIRALQEVPPTRICKDEFIEECNILYEQNPSVLQAIKEFKNTYCPEDAIRWYTRDGFVYKVLNKILREQNQRGIQLLHFFIYDLDRQLKKELRTKNQDWMKADTVRLYRGQLMSRIELEQLSKNKGEELFINSFLSTTTDLAVANMFSGAGAFTLNDHMQAVIFHIEWTDLNPKQGIADIRHLSFNGDEGEVLLSPTHTVNLLDCTFDENERVWNVKFTRLRQMDDPLIRIHDDERLMRLELTLRHLIEEHDSSSNETGEELDISSDSDEKKFEFSRKFCSTFVEDVLVLRDELELPALCSVTLNSDDSDRFELKTFRSFTIDSFDHGPKIHDEMVVTLYDTLGSVFKAKGNLIEAYYYYQKASLYDQPQTQTSYTRQAHLAQIHKINSNYELAWNIFDELMDQTNDIDNFLYEDIAFARSTQMSNIEFLQNSQGFLEFCSTCDDDESELFSEERISNIIDAWAELGYKYFYQNQNAEQAIVCYMREKELSVATSESQSSYFNPLIGSCPERMGDVYVSLNDIDRALVLYQEALALSKQATFVNNVMTTARCICKIGCYSLAHEPKTFHEAFQYLIHGYGKPYTQDTIGKCYMYLSRSLQRCKRYEKAMKYAKQALSIFLPDPLLLERLIDNCCQYIGELHQCLEGNNGIILTKDNILRDRIVLSDEQIKEMLQNTEIELKREMENCSNFATS